MGVYTDIRDIMLTDIDQPDKVLPEGSIVDLSCGCQKEIEIDTVLCEGMIWCAECQQYSRFKAIE